MVHIPKRFNIGVMLCLILMVSYMVRVNLAINIIAMKDDGTCECVYSGQTEANLLAAYFYGYMFTPLPGGLLAQRFGGRRVAGYSSLIATILTFLTPIVGRCNTVAIFIIRFFVGFVGGVIYPCCHNLISQWSPPDERGKFGTTLIGGTFGTVITWTVSGVVIEELGWQWAFYIESAIIGIVTSMWFYIVVDSPSKHSKISPEEIEHIKTSLGNTVSSQKKKKIPYKAFIRSRPMWALIFLHYGSSWGMFILQINAPSFMNEALGFTITSTGFLSALPDALRIIAAIMFGIVVDEIVRRKLLTVGQVRKGFSFFSHFLPGCLFLLIAFVIREPYLCVSAIAAAQFCTGASLVTNAVNALDLAPNFAAAITGIINSLGITTGILAPMAVAFFTRNDHTMEEWKWVFVVGATAYITTVLFFWVFGSGEVQKWNYTENDQ